MSLAWRRAACPVDDARMRALLAAAAVLMASACGASPSAAPAPAPLTVSGSVMVKGSSPEVVTTNDLTCTAGGGYTDIRQGAQVVVSDASAKTIALGQLGGGSWKRGVGCIFLFTVPDVPAGEKFYGIEVSHRGRTQYTAAQIAAPIELSIG